MHPLLIFPFLLVFTISRAAPVDQIASYSRKAHLKLLKSKLHPFVSAQSESQVGLTDTRHYDKRFLAARDGFDTRELLRALKYASGTHNGSQWIQSRRKDTKSNLAPLVLPKSLKRKELRFEPKALFPSTRQQGKPGLTFDFCCSSSECEGDRICRRINDDLICTPPDGIQLCTSDSDCVSGETCFDLQETNDTCASSTSFSGPKTTTMGLSLDVCSLGDDCLENRNCIATNAGKKCYPNDGLQSCTSDRDCVNGEFCDTAVESCLSETWRESSCLLKAPSSGTVTPNSSSEANPTPIVSSTGESSPTSPSSTIPTPSASPSPAPSSPESAPPAPEPPASKSPLPSVRSPIPSPCIAVNSLRHLPRSRLVYENDVLAKVLCDEKHSCATTGHIVSYDGRGMMMKSYCETLGGCTEKVMFVNSPKYERGLIVPSQSDGMVFTAFSARYETLAEERVLSFALRIGL